MRAPCGQKALSYLCLALAAGHVCASGPAGIKLDGTLGPSAAVLAGPMYNITQNLGKLSGGNLFFSFQYFNVATGETALFTTTSAGINNVISRVTGGYGSTIDGTIQLQAASGAPNFFLINPSGVTFTSNAVIDVPAAFYVSTASYLKFSDGNFYADPSQMSVLSAAAPEAFGFLGTTRAPVNIQGATLQAGPVGDGEFQIVAGDVTIDGDGNTGGISNTTGSVRVIAVGAQAAEVPLNGSFVSGDGSVTIQNGGLMTTQGGMGTAAGPMYLSAGSLTIDGMNANSRTGLSSMAGDEGAGPITVAASGGALIANGGLIYSQTAGGGVGADISMSAGTLTIQGASATYQTGILSENDAAGNGGAVSVTSGSLTMDGTSGVGGNRYRGIGSYETATASGASGAVSIDVSGAASIANGALIFAQTFGSGNAGAIKVIANSLSIDGGGTSSLQTGISANAVQGSTGAAGNIVVTAAGAISIANYGEIQTDAYGSGNAGDVTVNAGSISMNGGSGQFLTGISSQTEGVATRQSTDSTGNAGKVFVATTGPITLLDGAGIDSGSGGLGNAGDVNVSAASLSLDGGPQGHVTYISSNAYGSSGSAGKVVVTTTGALTVTEGGEISTNTFGSGQAGDVTINAASISIDGGTANYMTGLSSQAETGSTGAGGNINATVAGAISIMNSGEILTDTYGPGNAGDVTVKAASIGINGGSSQFLTGIASRTEGLASGQSTDSTGNAGKVIVTTSGPISVLNGAAIDTDSDGAGNAGDVTISAASLSLDGGPQGQLTYISSDAVGSFGSAGQVLVTITGALALAEGGYISSDTYTSGNGGDVTVKAGSISMQGGTAATQTSTGIATDTYASGNAGQVLVTAASISMNGGTSTYTTGISSETTGISNGLSVNSTGSAGKVIVNVQGPLTILNGADIDADSNGSGNAGNVTVSATSLHLDGGAQDDTTYISSDAIGPTGNGGKVVVSGGALTLNNGGDISSDTYGSGKGGDVSVSAATLSINAGPVTNTNFTGISTDANANSSGSAGAVTVSVGGNINIISGGIDALTESSGAAGSVSITTMGTLTIGGGGANTVGSNGIAAEVASKATAQSAGQPGSITISAANLAIDTGGLITVQNAGTVPDFTMFHPTLVMISVQNLDMTGGEITAASTANADASSIEVHYSQVMRAADADITTSAEQGNGGEISIEGSGNLQLDNSQITTSVLGTLGNGGNIQINVPVILMNTAAIQANTTAVRASGGAINIEAGAIIPSFESIILGGNLQNFDSALAGLNLIQAAAPDGVSGELNVTAPTLDLGNALLGLTGRPSAPPALGRGLCGPSHGSSFAISGRGGVAPTAYDPLWIDPEEAWREALIGSTYSALVATNTQDSEPQAAFACR
jgi:filamentous hemagglutinin family protein